MQLNQCLHLSIHRLNLIAGIVLLFSAARTVASPVPYAINVMNSPYSAVGDGTTDDTAAIQAAINAAGTSGNPNVVQIPYTSAGYLVSSTLTIGRNNIEIDGGGAVLQYTGAGPAIDAALIGGTIYPVNVAISNLTINLPNAAGTALAPIEGVRFRFSYSSLDQVSVTLQNSYQNGFEFPGDYANATGPYYNELVQLTAQGNATGSITNQNGVVFTYGASAPARCPNGNTFVSGTMTGLDTGWLINGSGNSLLQPTAVGNLTAAFNFTNPDSSVGCFDNSIYGSFVEGDSTATAFVIGSNAIRTFISPAEITLVGTVMADNGTSTQFFYPGAGGYQLALKSNAAVGLGLYQPGNVQVYVYSGNPNSHVTGGVGSLCLDLSGGSGTTLWVKESNPVLNPNTGWVAK